MAMKKGLAISALFLFVLAGCDGATKDIVQTQQADMPPKNQSAEWSSVPLPDIVLDKSGWGMYKNEKYGFQVAVGPGRLVLDDLASAVDGKIEKSISDEFGRLGSLSISESEGVNPDAKVYVYTSQELLEKDFSFPALYSDFETSERLINGKKVKVYYKKDYCDGAGCGGGMPYLFAQVDTPKYAYMLEFSGLKGIDDPAVAKYLSSFAAN